MVTGFFPGRTIMSEPCELCRRDALVPIYQPERSQRGLTVHLCQQCGLVQSLPRIDRAARAPMAISGGADWGNVRYGKGFRTKPALAALIRHADLSAPLSILDVGSNRGSFAQAMLEAAPSAIVTAIEPDERVADSCAHFARIELVKARIEETALESERFDIVHSCHTIEHLAEPARVLADHWRVLKPGGLLVLDAPNVAFLESDDIVEEWFIDKHLYHFSARTLMRMVSAAGFVIVSPPQPADRENLLLVARKVQSGRRILAEDPLEVAEAECLIAAYGAARARNLAALTFVAAEIADMAPKRVAIWGAGRLFDSLVVHGGFAPAMLSHLIDKHLIAHVGQRHGRTLEAPEALARANPDVIIVMSRGFASEIVAEARAVAPRAEIVCYSELLASAHLRKAA
jgi:2-polyprenyl-3-methyl-5-hydroxy-6-metoxy-1,4-benzoquinol methylase